MTIDETKNYLANLTSHITFNYNGHSCGIDPLSRNKFEMWYGEKEMTASSIDEVMNVGFFDGQSLTGIWDDIIDLEF